VSAPTAVITGLGEADAIAEDSLETMIFRAATAALADAGRRRDDLDGIVLAASDQTDGRAISSMLTAGPAGAYLNDEINAASSPGHALALGYMQILAGTHRCVLVSTWGKSSEAAGGSAPAERLSAEPFFERDGGLSDLAAAAMQAEAHRRPDPERGAEAAARVVVKNRAGASAAQVAASPLVAAPLRELELAPEIDRSFSLLLERADRDATAPRLAGVGWRADLGRTGERDLVALPHLAAAARDAYQRAGIEDPAAVVASWHVHDYTPDAEILAYAPLGVCAAGGAIDLALAGADRVNPDGGSLAGAAPFGGPMRTVLEAVRRARSAAERRFLVAQLSTGFAGQFQTVAVVEAGVVR
jgi:hypothetical protein